MNPNNKDAIAPMATVSKGVRRVFGLSLHGWENSMVVFLIIAGFFALLAGAATWAVVRLQRIELSESKTEFEKYKLETSKEVSNANARALEAQLALEKIKLPRRLTEEQWAAIAERLKPFGKISFDMAVNDGDPEAQRLANSILFHLWQVCGWKPISWVQPGASILKFPMPNFPDWGVNTFTIGVDILIVPSDQSTVGDAAKLLGELLIENGVSASARVEGSHSTNANTIHILVGSKPL